MIGAVGLTHVWMWCCCVLLRNEPYLCSMDDNSKPSLADVVDLDVLCVSSTHRSVTVIEERLATWLEILTMTTQNLDPILTECHSLDNSTGWILRLGPKTFWSNQGFNKDICALRTCPSLPGYTSYKQCLEDLKPLQKIVGPNPMYISGTAIKNETLDLLELLLFLLRIMNVPSIEINWIDIDLAPPPPNTVDRLAYLLEDIPTSMLTRPIMLQLHWALTQRELWAAFINLTKPHYPIQVNWLGCLDTNPNTNPITTNPNQ
ncbi:hypothetical protein NEHOM01_1649 [Nematocida homosporus]|uniref:uncharacterized protein n=1 Tax=Nematocida homosporus TaxID=1912981 RepID=UPI00221EBECB|nr:uncharacterized protein NEHOM01_1649 [Nematocida homosporus]KAI5186710.1 hypothetical protein NEHOM01_1649 [Nematocida homosporus]